MKKLKNILFGFLSIGLLFTGTSVEAKTVSWDDLVIKLKNGQTVEYLESAKTSDQDVSYSITSDDTKFVATSVIDGVTNVFQLNYDESNGLVTYTANYIIDTYEEAISDESTIAIMDSFWIYDVILSTGNLYGYNESEVENFLDTVDENSLTLDKDGIEVVNNVYNYEEDVVSITITQPTSVKLSLVNGFGGLGTTDDSQNANPDVPAEPVTTPEPTIEPTPTPGEAPIENPSTGDVQIYQIVGGIVVCLTIVIVAIKKISKKEDII